MKHLKQSTAYNLMILMIDNTDHISGKAGLTLTITASKNGAAFSTITPTFNDRGNGWYSITLDTTMTNALGDLALHITGTGADPLDLAVQVFATTTDDLVRSTTPANKLSINGAGNPGVDFANVNNLTSLIDAILFGDVTTHLGAVNGLAAYLYYLRYPNSDSNTLKDLIISAISLVQSDIGTIGSTLSEILAGGSGGSVDPAEVAAALKPVIAAVLAGGKLTYAGPVALGGDASIIRGDDYLIADGCELSWSSAGWPDIEGSTVEFKIGNGIYEGSYDALAKTIYLELNSDQTSAFVEGVTMLEAIATLVSGHKTTLVRSKMTIS